jgi:hypothetical protein
VVVIRIVVVVLVVEVVGVLGLGCVVKLSGLLVEEVNICTWCHRPAYRYSISRL